MSEAPNPSTVDPAPAAPTLPRLGRVGVFSLKLSRLPRLKTFLNCERLVVRPNGRQASGLDAVIGWGHKPSAKGARDYARRYDIPYLALEDGFLRSVRLGHQDPPLSLIVDDVGIYYDASGPSQLEQLLSETGERDVLADPALIARARHCRARINAAGLSKYNHTRGGLPQQLAEGGPYVLLVDQTFNDASVNLGRAGVGTFQELLAAVVEENPGARFVVKAHPDAIAGTKSGYLSQTTLPDSVELVAKDVNPVALLQGATRVYTCTSQLGFEALLAGKPVVCFGAPFYAGWGLTDDRVPVPRRGVRRTVDELLAASLLCYPRYVHPVTGQLSEAENVIEHLSLQRRTTEANARDFYCVGFTPWKRPFVRRYLAAPGNRVHFVRSKDHAIRLGLGETRPGYPPVIVRWVSRSSEDVVGWAHAKGIDVWNMEDGFLRSVSLGSDLTAPGSLVLDRLGIYYDPSAPSELEQILQDAEFTSEELQQADELRQLILRTKISKYNTDSYETLDKPPADKEVIFVPGQVEDDASVLCGGLVRTNEELLRRVREANPETYILYKPHPDVTSGNRKGKLIASCTGLYDALTTSAPIDECLLLADEVHTITSFVGFEALLRGLRVTTYGQPFYGGWGLTTDQARSVRRTRILSIEQLIAAVLIRYPRYYNFQARAFVSPADKVAELAERRDRSRAAWLPPTGMVPKVRNLASSALEWARD